MNEFPWPPEKPWEVHVTSGRWPRSGGCLFLAEAAQELGAAMFTGWTSECPSWMYGEEMPYIPEARYAFTADGEPVAGVYDLYAGAVRQVLSVGFYQHLQLMKGPMEDWLASMVPNPDGGDPLPLPLLRSRRKEDADDEITSDHWESAWWHAQILGADRESAWRYIPAVADRLLNLVQRGEVQTFSRPFHGGAPVPIDARDWEIDCALNRLATCAFNPADPLAPTAVPTHWVFVGEQGFREALLSIEPITLATDFEPDDDDDAPDAAGVVVPHPSKAAARRECEAWLVQRFDNPETGRMRKEHFKEECLRKFVGRLSGRGFETAWAAAGLHRPDRVRPGRRPDA